MAMTLVKLKPLAISAAAGAIGGLAVSQVPALQKVPMAKDTVPALAGAATGYFVGHTMEDALLGAAAGWAASKALSMSGLGMKILHGAGLRSLHTHDASALCERCILEERQTILTGR